MQKDFVEIGLIKPKRKNNGDIFTETVYEKYKNKYKVSLNEYGSGPFCRFSISTRWNHKKGVYAFVIDSKPVYIGETVNLAGRINNGIGKISPSACYTKGQSTNCRINNLILDEILSGKIIKLVFFETDDSSSYKSNLINEYKPNWNKIK